MPGDRPPARVSIVGSGSLGLVLAGALSEAGNVVTVLARPQSAADLLDRRSIEVNGRLTITVPVASTPARPAQVRVTDLAGDLGPADVVLFTTKGQDLAGPAKQVAATWPAQRGETALVAGLQNGLVKDELLAAAFGAADVVGAATVLGSRRLSPGAVSVSGLGTTFFGEFAVPSSSRVDRVVAMFVGAGLPCTAVADIRSLLWTKYANAIGVFGVSAVTALPSVEIFARRPLALAYRSLLEEAASVAEAEGARIGDFPDLAMRTYLSGTPEESAAEMARRVGPRGTGPVGISSMAQDIAAGRPTEVEETFGDLLRRARAHGIDVPRAELVYRLIAGGTP
jgi:2-dehydropantoate 2-reductase